MQSFFNSCSSLFVFFFLLVQKETKKTPEIDNSPISGGFPDVAFVLL